MTAHQLARQLLAGPDLPVYVPHDEDCMGYYVDPIVEQQYFRERTPFQMGHSMTRVGEHPTAGAVKAISL